MTPREEKNARIGADFREFVSAENYSCLAGRGVINANRERIGIYGVLGSMRSARALAADLGDFVKSAENDGGAMEAMIAVFPSRAPIDEAEFEARLWQQLQHLHQCDAAKAAWAEGASDDPEHPRFSFSFGGKALYVIGMHPRSSRLARRFRYPALVFNPHEQFDELRESGRFEKLRTMVREREMTLQGSLNPTLADFGERSEAAQYSGRTANEAWKCPFHRKAE